MPNEWQIGEFQKGDRVVVDAMGGTAPHQTTRGPGASTPFSDYTDSYAGVVMSVDPLDGTVFVRFDDNPQTVRVAPWDLQREDSSFNTAPEAMDEPGETTLPDHWGAIKTTGWIDGLKAGDELRVEIPWFAGQQGASLVVMVRERHENGWLAQDASGEDLLVLPNGKVMQWSEPNKTWMPFGTAHVSDSEPGDLTIPDHWGSRGMPFERFAAFVLQAQWADVMSKAKRLVQENKVTILNNTPQSIIAHVIGDTGEHDVEIAREDPESGVLTQTVCDCPWNQYRWDRTRPYKALEGRPCSHILATYWKAKSTPIDSEAVPFDYQAPVGQRGPATAPGQQTLPIPAQPEAQPPEQQPELPSTQQIVTPPSPENPFQAPQGAPGESGPMAVKVPQREQMKLFDVAPQPGGVPPAGPAPSFSMPGGTPPSPANVQIPGTFSHVSSVRWGMAEKSGDPELDSLIAKFKNTRLNQPVGMSDHDWYSPELMWGQCVDYSHEFTAYCLDHGVEAEVTYITAHGQDPQDWQAPNAPQIDTDLDSWFSQPDDPSFHEQPKDFDSHAVVMVTLNGHTYVVDWTAAQFGYYEAPMVHRQDNGDWQREWEGAPLGQVADEWQRGVWAALMSKVAGEIKSEQDYEYELWQWAQGQDEIWERLRKFVDLYGTRFFKERNLLEPVVQWLEQRYNDEFADGRAQYWTAVSLGQYKDPAPFPHVPTTEQWEETIYSMLDNYTDPRGGIFLGEPPEGGFQVGQTYQKDDLVSPPDDRPGDTSIPDGWGRE